MEQELTRDQKERKKYIELFVDKLYTRFNYLFTESLDVVKQKAMDKYLNSDMSISAITEDMIKIIEEMKAEYDRQQKAAAAKKVDDMPTTSVEEENIVDNGMPVTAAEETVVEHQDIPVTAATPQPELDVMPTVAVGPQPELDVIPTTAVEPQPEKDNIPNVAHINYYDQARMVDDYSAGAISKAPSQAINKAAPNALDELNSMLEDKPKEEKIDNSNELEKPKQFVKTNNADNGNDSKGFASVFNIVLSILAVAAFVLVAMILNLLLK